VVFVPGGVPVGGVVVGGAVVTGAVVGGSVVTGGATVVGVVVVTGGRGVGRRQAVTAEMASMTVSRAKTPLRAECT
jgi:hypothetical protein